MGRAGSVESVLDSSSYLLAPKELGGPGPATSLLWALLGKVWDWSRRSQSPFLL